MGKLHYDITGAEAIVRDVPIYTDTTGIAKGELVQAHAGGDDESAQFITSNALTSAAGTQALGMCNETITTTSKADYGDHITTAATATTDAISSPNTATYLTGNRYGKVIINPFAIYLLDYADASNSTDAFQCAATSNSITYTDTVEDNVGGSWMYIVPGLSSAADGGQLRYISLNTSTTADWTLLTAITTTTSDYAIKILRVNHAFMEITATAGLSTQICSLDNDAGACISYGVVNSYVGGSLKPMEPLRQQIHDGLNDTSLKFYSDIVQLDHVYNPSITL